MSIDNLRKLRVGTHNDQDVIDRKTMIDDKIKQLRQRWKPEFRKILLKNTIHLDVCFIKCHCCNTAIYPNSDKDIQEHIRT